jgi:hypothetical protein
VATGYTKANAIACTAGGHMNEPQNFWKLLRRLTIRVLAIIGLIWCAAYIVELTRFQTLAVVQETATSGSYTIVRDRILHVTYRIDHWGHSQKIHL